MQERPAAEVRTAPERPDRDPRVRGTWAGLALALGFGILADAAVGAPPGVAMTLGCCVAVVAIQMLAKPRRATVPFLAAGVVLGGFFVVRASSTLAVLDLIGVVALLFAATSFGRSGDPAATTFRSYAMRATLAPFGAVPDGARSLTDTPSDAFSGHRTSLATVARLIMLVVPVALLLVLLFGTADPVFRRYVLTPLRFDPSSWPSHVLEVGAGAVALATLVAATRRTSPVGDAAQQWLRVGWAGPLEWASLLVVVDALFAIFVAIQFTVFFGGRTRVLSEEGLTYAEYARSGFWQLLAAAGVAGGVLVFAWLALPRPSLVRARRTFLGLSLTLLGMVLVVLVSAYQRLSLYEEAYGFTPLRVLVHTTFVSLAALFACTIVALVRGRASWLPAAAVVIATVALIGVNVLNLDAFIARENLARAAGGAELDVAELWFLSADAVHPAIEARSALGDFDRERVDGFLSCMRDRLIAQEEAGWAGVNLSRASALAELRELTLPGCGDPIPPI